MHDKSDIKLEVVGGAGGSRLSRKQEPISLGSLRMRLLPQKLYLAECDIKSIDSAKYKNGYVAQLV